MNKLIATAAFGALGLSGCAALDGNPDGAAYAGGRGSVYDAAANPPRTIGIVTYDPLGPLPAMPADVAGAEPSVPGPLTAEPNFTNQSAAKP